MSDNQNPLAAPAPESSPAQELAARAKEETLKNRVFDLVLVVDMSGSMAPCINNLHGNLNALISALQKYQGGGAGSTAVDLRVGIVGHRSKSHDGKIDIVLLDLMPAAEESRLTSALKEVVQQPSGSEATLHAMDWAMDNITWTHFGGDAMYQRKMLAVFTDEPVEGGDLTGMNETSLELFQKKLLAFNVFLVAPLQDAGRPIGYSMLLAHEFIKGQFDVPDENAWASIDFKTLLEKIGKTQTKSAADLGVQKNVFGASFVVTNL